MAITATAARFSFRQAIGDVEALVAIHDAQTAHRRGRPSSDLEVVKRAGVILTVTAWESYVEDTLRYKFRLVLDAAAKPADVTSAFNEAARCWYQTKTNKPEALLSWTGDSWKNYVWSVFTADIDRLHSPKTENVKKLFRKYLDTDVTQSWSWSKTSPAAASQRLDELVSLRGGLVHRGAQIFQERQSVRHTQLLSGIRLVKQLVERTDRKLGIGPRNEFREVSRF